MSWTRKIAQPRWIVYATAATLAKTSIELDAQFRNALSD